MAKKIRLGYDILSKRAIETKSGVNIDDALKRKDQEIADINTAITNIEGDITNIQAVIPDDASSDNKLITTDQVEQKISDVISNSDLIYLDDVNGDDTNDGLTKNTSVRTIAGAIRAFKDAQENNSYFKTVKIYVVTESQETPIQIASDEDLSILTNYSNGIWLYGKSIRLANTVGTAPLIVHYSLHIIAENVNTYITRSDDVSALNLKVECVNYSGYCMTTDSIDIEASSNISLNGISGPGDDTHTRPNLFLRSNGQIYVSSGTFYCNMVNMTAMESINVYGDIYVSYSYGLFRSLEGTVTFYNNLNAIDTNGNYLNVYIDSCYGVRNNAGITCGDLIINAGKKYSSINDNTVTIAGGNYIHGNMVVQCYNFEPAGGAHQYYGDLKVKAEYINLMSSAGTFYLHTKGIFIANKFFKGSPTIQANELYVKVNSNISIADNSTTDSYLYTTIPYRDSDSIVVNKNGKYVFEMGNSPFHIMYSGIQNPFADVTIISTNKVYLAESNTAHYSKSLNIKAKDLTLYDVIHTGFFNIDVDNMIEQSTPGCYIVMEKEYNQDERDYISYDSYSNNYLKCGSLYCSIRYSVSDGSCGLIQTSYGMAVKNIDIQVGMVLCPQYYTDSMGVMSPQVLGMCHSGVDTFNSVISGHVGGYVGYNNGPRNFKPSAWNHDVRQIPPSYIRSSTSPKPNDADYGLVTIKFDDVYETNHFYFDPCQGDDALDGCTRQTAVKTTAALARAIMRKAGYSQDSNNSTFYVYNGVTIHILSVNTGSMYNSSSPTSVSALQDIANSFVNGQGIDFTFMDGYGGWKLQFQFIEFVPEAPNMSLYVKGLTAQVIQARGFYGIHLNCVDTVGSNQGIGLLDAVDTVSIYNNGYYGNFPFYSSRFNCLTVRARNICLAGMFNNLKAVAQDTLYIFDTTGYSYDSSDNCCLCGNTKLESQDVTLGAWIYVSGGTSYYSYVGINGYCTIKAYNTLTTHVDSFVHAVCFIDAGQYIGGVFASQYFKGKLFVKCENCSWGMDTSGGTYTSFATYQSTSNQGGAGIISIEAYNQISVEYWGSSNSTNQQLYGVDLYLKAPYIRGGTLFLYGNNGYGYVVVDCPRQLALSILPYYYNTFILRAGVVSSQVGAYSGGPFSPSGNTAMLLRFNIHDLQVPIRLYTSQMSSYTSYVISGYIDVARCKVLDWGQTIDPDNPPSIYPPSVTFDFALVVGHSTLSGHGFDLTDWVPDNSGTIIVLNDQKSLIAGQGINISDTGDNVVISSDPKSIIVQKPVTIDNGTATAQLTLNRYNVITGIDRTVTDLVIDFPVESTATLLTEIGFEFYLDGLAQDLNSVTFTNSTEQFSSVVPDEFTAGHIYQGVLVNRCITLVEYDRPDENVMEINGVKYRTVKIGDQTWMAENVADPTTGVWYENDQSTYEPLGYGKLYTQSEADALASAASGWHLPTKADYETLLTTVGGASQYNKLKSTTGWIGDNNGTNESGFNGYPAGYGWNTGSGFSDVTKYSYFRTATAGDTSGNHKFFQLCPSSDAVFQEMSDQSKLSVRLVKDMSVNIGGRDYKVVQIGNQLWLAENLDWKFNTLNFRDSSNNPLDTTTAIQAAYYNYDESTYGVNGNKYGLLYNWYAVDYLNQHLAELGVPDGWHVPTRTEWEAIVTACGENPGTKLKSTTGWNGSGTYDNGIDYYGFTSVPTGFWEQGFYSVGDMNRFWTSIESSSGYAYRFGLSTGSSSITNTADYERSGYSLRLVKNLT